MDVLGGCPCALCCYVHSVWVDQMCILCSELSSTGLLCLCSDVCGVGNVLNTVGALLTPARCAIVRTACGCSNRIYLLHGRCPSITVCPSSLSSVFSILPRLFLPTVLR